MPANANLLPPLNQKVGEIIEISVPTNPTTGFACTLAKKADCIYLVSSTYVPHHPVMPGSGGSQIFKFIAVAKGEGEIEFREVRFSHPLEILPPDQMHKRFVIISE